MSIRECLQASMEEAVGLQREVEVVVYAEIKDFAELLKAKDVERQFQWSIRSKNETNTGNIRVRCTNDTEFTQTTKVKRGDDTAPGKDEKVIAIDADQFELFSMISESGMYKDRYTFPIPDTDLVWEVDCFITKDGQYAPWCKIDLEFPAGTPVTDMSDRYPITLGEILQQSQSDRLDVIYDEFIIVKPGLTAADFATKPVTELRSQLAS